MNEQDIFLAAIEITDLTDRAAYVDEACGADASLRAQVVELLKSHDLTSQFLETPAVAADSAVIETMLTNPADSNEELSDERTSGEEEFRRYLQPATRPGWLGRLAHYEIEEILGRGAFGIVAKAFDEKLHRIVAIKLMNPELATTSPPRKRFLREARTAAAVTHENLVAIHAVEEEPIPYLVMEYVPGQTLQQLMSGNGPLEVADILRIGQQVASGLAAAHTVNLIHRDIKPSNILLTEGPNERAKISDFGLARAVDDASLTSSGLIAGTPMYMAPEQARGETLDHRADLFSLGSVLYQMASGHPPFRAANTVAVLRRVCEDTPRPLDDVIPETPSWLATIIFRLLEKKREDRFQTAQEVADLLARCQNELQHYGRVTCVKGRSGAAGTQVFQAKTGSNSRPWKKYIGGLIGGLAVVAVVIGLATMNGGGKAGPEREVTSELASVAGVASPESPSETAETPEDAVSWHGWPADAPPPAIAPFDADQALAHQKAWAEYLKIPVEYENSLGMKFRLIPPGEFLMGSTPEEIEVQLKKVGDNEQEQKKIQSAGPQHKVILTQPVYVGVTEVTQAQYEQVMKGNQSEITASDTGKKLDAGLSTSNHAARKMTWPDAVEFCAKLSQQEELKSFYSRSDKYRVTPLEGTGYRLPTEAEWEFACRAGTTTRYWSGDRFKDLMTVGWFSYNSGNKIHSVGELKANPFGLFDMHGNVEEWVQDSWDVAFYGTFSENAAIDPYRSFLDGHSRSVRGGGVRSNEFICRSSARFFVSNYMAAWTTWGFRVVLAVDGVKKKLE
ncbi:MAG TPA: hypothetical protein DIT97_07485 [Gimesia maris]|uniref:non-specific serine/threonine protein kinase n=1 Tax=Gimesia maris TaxID=122 RepID=A0A3D3R5J1_9PLAN|nr:hypothetical protein [Gimesia maris]|tara:strand:- start:901 stop:3273 length:2373 start_codon:yes stop_codon:yes gene_type:complete